jgi:hypothetical protein
MATNATQIKPDETKQNQTEPETTQPDVEARDQTKTYITQQTLDRLVMDYINGRHTVPQKLIDTTTRTAKNGGGMEITHEDEAANGRKGS